MTKTFLYKSYCFFYKVDKWRHRRFTVPGGVISYSVLITGILSTDTRGSLVYQVFALLFAVWSFSFLWSRWVHPPKVSAIRELPRYATAGEPLIYQVKFVNPTAGAQSGLHFYENTMDLLPSMEELLTLREPGEEKRNLWDRNILYYRWLWIISKKRILEDLLHTAPDLPPGGEATMRVQAIPQRRGYLHFHGFEIVRSDPFGLCKARLSIAAHQTLMVLPRRYRLPPLLLPGGQRHHAGGVSLASSIGNHEEFVSLRDYRPGDSMRRIHWKSSAKKGAPVIKEFQDEYYVHHALILDTFSDAAFSAVFEEAVSLAASFVCALQTQESLLDLMFVGTQAHCFSSGRGTTSYDYLLEILAAVQTCRNKSFDTIAPVVFKHLDQFSSCICVLLAWDAPRQKLVRDLIARGVPLRVFLVLEETPAPPIDPGPMTAYGKHFVVLTAGEIEKGLAAL